MTVRKNNERWISYIKTILEGELDHLYDQKNNELAKQEIQGCLNTLVAGLALSANQKNLLIKHIRTRVPLKTGFKWKGSVVLTRKQRNDALKNPDLVKYIHQITPV